MQSCIIDDAVTPVCCSSRGVPMSAIFSSLAAFVAAGFRPQTALAKAIVLVLLLKLVGIVAIKLIMFPDNARPAADSASIERVLGPSISVR
jgi:hypothetical protein